MFDPVVDSLFAAGVGCTTYWTLAFPGAVGRAAIGLLVPEQAKGWRCLVPRRFNSQERHFPERWRAHDGGCAVPFQP